MDWFAGCVLIYMTLFGVGKIIFGQASVGLAFLALAALAGGVLYWDLTAAAVFLSRASSHGFH